MTCPSLFRRWLGGALLAAAVLTSAPSAAQGTKLERARTLFNAGAKAYEANDYPAAIQAFQQAYRIVSREGLLFSIAQAYRRQYYVDRHPQHLQQAIEHYRKYRRLVPAGGRSGDAAAALAELEPLVAQPVTTEEGEVVAPVVPGLPQAQTRLMVQTKTKGAQISVDGGPLQKMPLIDKVEAGIHRIRIVAEGYYDEEREVPATGGVMTALDIQLRERPATVVLDVGEGAEVSVDGRPAGVTPLAAPLELPAGEHLLAVSLNGHEGYAEELVLERGEARNVEVALEQTGQRVASYVLFGTAIAGAAAGGVFTALAMDAQNDARAIEDRIGSEMLSQPERDEYNDAVGRRGDWRLGAVISFGAAVLLAGTGGLLHGFDTPSVQAPARRGRPGTAEPEEPDVEAPEETNMEMAAAPVWIPGGALAVVQGRF